MARKKKRQSVAMAGDGAGEEEAEASILDDDSMVQIFNFISTRYLLTHAAFVCKRWRRLCQIQIREIVPQSVPIGKILSKALVLTLVSKHASTLETVHLAGMAINDEETISIISLLPAQLKNLTVTWHGSSLEKLINCLPTQLTTLSLLRRPLKPGESSPGSSQECSFFKDLHARCPVLESLELDHMTVTEKTCYTLLECFPNIKSLEINSLHIGWDEVYSIVTTCKSLLNLYIISSKLDNQSMKTANLDGLPPGLHSLKLYTSRHQCVSFASWPALNLLLKSGNQLTHMHAQNSYSYTWEMLISTCVNVKVLDLSMVKLSSSPLFTPHEIEVLCKIPVVLKKLERVCLPTASDRILTQFGRACSNLIEFRFHCVGVTPTVTNIGVLALVEGCNKLEILSLESCDKITITSTRSIKMHLTNLKVLHLGKCKLLDDDAVQVLFPKLSTTLRLLDVNGCSITSATLQYLCHGGNNLRVLAIKPSLWKQCQAFIKETSVRYPQLCVNAGPAYAWTGLHHAPDLMDL